MSSQINGVVQVKVNIRTSRWCRLVIPSRYTITEEVESESLTWEPGRKATVLAHNDFAVEGPGVQ